MIDSTTLARRLLALDPSRLVVRRSADQVDRLRCVAEAVGVAAPRVYRVLNDAPLRIAAFVKTGEVLA